MRRIEVAESVVDAIDSGSRKILTKTNRVMKQSVLPISDVVVGKAVDFVGDYASEVRRKVRFLFVR